MQKKFGIYVATAWLAGACGAAYGNDCTAAGLVSGDAYVPVMIKRIGAPVIRGFAAMGGGVDGKQHPDTWARVVVPGMPKEFTIQCLLLKADYDGKVPDDSVK